MAEPAPVRPEVLDEFRIPHPRVAVANLCERILDIVEGETDSDPTLYELEAQLRQWWQASRADGFPTRASGAESTGGGATNVVHNFGTDESPDLQEVPQHSDPTGEIVANRAGDTKRQAIIDAFDLLEQGTFLIGRARNTLVTALRPPEELPTELAEARSREWCWSCLRHREANVRTHTDVYREALIDGERTPLCRRCADWFYARGALPPVPVVGVWSRGERLTSSRLEQLGFDAQGNRLAVKAKPKPKRTKSKTKRKRRR